MKTLKTIILGAVFCAFIIPQTGLGAPSDYPTQPDPSWSIGELEQQLERLSAEMEASNNQLYGLRNDSSDLALLWSVYQENRRLSSLLANYLGYYQGHGGNNSDLISNADYQWQWAVQGLYCGGWATGYYCAYPSLQGETLDTLRDNNYGAGGGPIGTGVTVGQAIETVTGYDFGACGITSWAAINQCLLAFINWLLTFFLKIVGLLVYAAAQFFNYSIEWSVVRFHDIATDPAIKEAWGVARDVVNMFFIFVLLYIGISLILGLVIKDAKRAIVSVIATAVLINFSGVIARVIIDGGNVLAVAFYHSSISTAMMNDDPDGAGTDLAETIMGESGMNISNVVTEAAGSEDPLTQSTADGPNVDRDWGGVIGGFLLKLFLIFGVTIILTAAAVLFSIRLVVLTSFLIIAPLIVFAYGMPIPSLRSRGKELVGKFLGQVILAPAYLFFFYVTVRIITSDHLHQLFAGTSPGGAEASTATSAFVIYIYYVLIGGLLFYSLQFAKQFADYGQGAVLGQAEKWEKRARDVATASRLRRGARERAQHMVGRIGESLLKSQGDSSQKQRRWFNPNRYISPLATAAVTAAAGSTQKRSQEAISEREKYYEGLNLSNQALKNYMNMSTTSRTDKAAIAGILVRRGDTSGVSPQYIEQAARFQQQVGTSGAARLVRDQVRAHFKTNPGTPLPRHLERLVHDSSVKDSIDLLKDFASNPEQMVAVFAQIGDEAKQQEAYMAMSNRARIDLEAALKANPVYATLYEQVAGRDNGPNQPRTNGFRQLLSKEDQDKVGEEEGKIRGKGETDTRLAGLRSLLDPATNLLSNPAIPDADVALELRKLAGDDVTKLKHDTLKQPQVARNLSKAQLAQLREKLPENVRDAIRHEIEAALPSTDPKRVWLNTDTNGQLF